MSSLAITRVLCANGLVNGALEMRSPRVSHVHSQEISLSRPPLVVSLTLSIGISLLHGVTCAVEPAATFAPTGDPHTERFSEHTATRLHDGTVLVTGGWDGTVGRFPSRLKATAEIFDPKTNEWTAVASMNRTRSGHTATLLASGQVLVVGGPDAEIFDPATGRWLSAGKLAQPRARHTATRLEDGRVAVVGGFVAEGEVTTSVELYDPQVGKWLNGGQLLEPRAYQTAFGLPDNRILLAGGENPRNTPTAEIYDSQTKRSVVAAPPAETTRLLPGFGFPFRRTPSGHWRRR